MYTLRFLDKAFNELKAEARYSKSKWGVSHARKYMSTLESRIKSLCKNPHLYRTHDDLLPGLRLMTFKGNQVFFWIDEQNKRVVILGVPSIYRELSPETLKQRLSSY